VTTVAGSARGFVWPALLLLSVFGSITSGYLTYSHYADEPTECAGIGSCEYVQTSEYADILGFPVAVMGLLFFLVLGSLCLWILLRRDDASWALPAAFSMTLAGSAFVAYLTYVELFVIDAICPWCVATALITVACLGVTCLAAFASVGDGQIRLVNRS
jgi:uncharacterized membrane protein